MHNEAEIEKSLEIVNSGGYYLPQKRAAFFPKTCADAQQVLLVQTGLYRSDE